MAVSGNCYKIRLVYPDVDAWMGRVTADPDHVPIGWLP
jgi:hypothetical protein